ncbi:MAG TPA: PstS family phosphate ABC transporter substrate-binding protein [Burkholderiales bacterium]
MNLKRTLLGAAAAAGIAASTAGQTAGLVQIDGSSTVYPVTEAVAEEFQKAKRGKVMVTVGVSGTGGGFKKFCRGETDISNASRPILEKEMELCRENGIKYMELPVAFDALTVVTNKQNDWLDYLTIEELKRMWEPAAQGRITNWKQIRAGFPDAPLVLFGPGADSGTFDYFTEAVTGESKASRGDFTASEDDNVLVQGVSRNKNALGYFGFAYYTENADKLKAVPIAPKAGATPVAPSLETVVDGTYQPLARPIFIYVSDKGLRRPEVREFVQFYLENAAALAQEVGYVPLPAKAYELAMNNFRNNRLGTGFGGRAEAGVMIEDLLKREAKL